MRKKCRGLPKKGGIIKVKKLIVLVCLATLMCFGFVGCKEKSSTAPPAETTAVAPAEETTAPSKIEKAVQSVEKAAPAAEEAATTAAEKAAVTAEEAVPEAK
ncbi:MAG: hypothetical protein LWX01_12355 [Deltaproteobacteria bacterium]|nr:hypothetical protein [Deltaproteobacteria bacterium]